MINIDSLHQFDFNPNTLFTFYTSTSYTKEGETKFTKENELSFPEESVFSKLNTTVDGKEVESYGGAFDDDALIELLSKVLLNEYKSQYSKKKYNGNLGSIKQWDLENWKDFFRRIKFFFGEPNHEEIYKDVETLVKSLPQYSDDLIGKEGLIISALLEEVEKTQYLEGSSKGYVTNKSIELVYEQLKNGSRRLVDPSWMSWEKVEKPKDLRNIEEKIRDVLNDPDQNFMDRINRRAANGLTKTQEHNEDKTLKAVLYIIYDCCEEELNELVKNKESMTEQEITDSIRVLVEKSYEDIKEKASDYSYIVTNKKSIQELVLYLVDSCYLAFD
ncbi:hypothetical protein [Halobacteriovorax sp. JY17]|uniref:hypothetical protein n=1 Tax=Halobacteriovorax sp. JY17 TaxID=2014617 RepID=UPI000C4C2E65|nr:hypothetical protein [Halobacteriovorax sp. JY17]PIK13531.1 MAG: hypothetical protein CES88_16560 [Halobacteriovorax sp. JY17]